MLLLIVTVLVFILSLSYWFMVWNFNYWKRLGVKGPRPSILFGNFPSQLARKYHMAHDVRNIYEYVVIIPT